jgi:hypothetical protein
MGAGFLAAIVGLTGPIIARALVALGFAVVTIGGVTVAINTLKAEMLAMLGQAPMAALQLIGLGGGWVALGLLFGAMTFAVSFWTLTSAQRIIAKP